MIKAPRRALLASALALPFIQRAHAQTPWPDRPVRIIIPFGAGGPIDLVGRLLAEHLKERLGQPFIIENRPGAGGSIGIHTVVQSPPDGTAFVLTSASLASVPALYPNRGLDPRTALAPVSLVADIPTAMVVRAASPYQSVQEVLAAARAEPGRLTYGSGGVGSSNHLSGALFALAANLDLTHVSYRGAAPAHIDLAGGRVHMIFDNIPQALALARDGKVRALAVTGAQRSPQAPEIPALAEFLPGFDISSWGGVCAPAGISPALIRRINELTKQSLDSEDIKKRFYDNGATTWYTTPEEFVKFRADNEAAFAPLIRASGAKVD